MPCILFGERSGLIWEQRNTRYSATLFVILCEATATAVGILTVSLGAFLSHNCDKLPCPTSASIVIGRISTFMAFVMVMAHKNRLIRERTRTAIVKKGTL